MSIVEKLTANRLKPEDVWILDHDLVCELARFLVDYGTLASADDVLSFFEKPSRWIPERARWVAAGKPDPEAAPEDLFETVGDVEGEGDGS